MAVREFDGIDDNIICATGGLFGMTHGTVAVLVQRRTSGDFYALMGVNDSGGALLGSILVWSNSNWAWFTSSVGSQGPASPLNTWALMIVRKASGSSTPRFSIYDFTAAAWTHANGAASQGNWTASGADGEIAFTDAANDHPAIRIAARAAWANEVHWSADAAGDSAVEAAGLETALANWLAESPTALWRFNQASTTEGVVDETGNGAGQTAITGTTVVTGDDPPGFDFELGGGTDLIAADASHPHTADSPALTQVHQLTVESASHGHTADSPALTQLHGLTANDTEHSQTADQPTIVQVHQLTVDDALHAQAASQSGLAQAHQLAAEDASHAQAADQPLLTQQHELAADTATHQQAAESPELTGSGTIAADDASHGHTAGELALGQVHELAAGSASHAQVASQPTLASGVSLAAEDATHGHAAGEPTLAQQHVLAVAATTHAQAATEAALTQLHQLVADPTTHRHTATEAALGADNTIPPPDTGTIARPNTGVILRPSAGTITRPESGVVSRPDTGTVTIPRTTWP